MPPKKQQPTERAPDGAADAPAGRDPAFAPDPPDDQTTDDLEAADEPDPEPPAKSALPFMSAGVASDLEMRGWAGDPATGGMFRRDPETGEITYTPRA